MKILIYSPAFHPSVGGLEFMAKVLAEEFTALGHRVMVATTTPDAGDTQFAFDVIRNPSPRQLVGIFRMADVILHMNMSLRALWPFAFVKRPLIVVHNGFYRRGNGRLGIRDRLKYWISKFVTNISCSDAVKTDLPADSAVVGNAYDENVFALINAHYRVRDLVFVGRLVSEKGVDLLLHSLCELRQRGLRPSLTIVGFGPEEGPLMEHCRQKQLLDQVVFQGKRTGSELAELLNQHRIMVVPSRNEGFGVVALEGIACGCVLVASDAGGLPEAIGECGIVFRNGDVADLSKALNRALTDNAMREQLLSARANHIARFSRREVAKRYIEVIEGAVRVSRQG